MTYPLKDRAASGGRARFDSTLSSSESASTTSPSTGHFLTATARTVETQSLGLIRQTQSMNGRPSGLIPLLTQNLRA